MNPRVLQETQIRENNAKMERAVNRTSLLKEFFALIKIGIVYSNLLTVFAGTWLALYFSRLGALDHLDIVFFTLSGAALIIAGSCAINNLLDRDIDVFMERTKDRPTVTGRAGPYKVLFMGSAFIAAGLLFLLQTTLTAAILGIIGVFSYVVLYTIWTKRRYVANTIVGSISGAVPPLIGWAAVAPDLHLLAWGLFLIMFIWQPPHFYSLAMKRAEEYRAAGVPMLPVVKGEERAKRSTILWIALLFPAAFILYPLGMPLIIWASALNLYWFVMALYLYRKKTAQEWAQKMFVFSLQYLPLLFLSMIAITFL